ncbi:MAG: hypothetical protein WC071_13935 [Victivallaceae bacterium]
MKSKITVISLMAAGIAFSTIAADTTPAQEATTAPAQETVIPAKKQCARIDIDGSKDKINLKPVKGMANAAWMKKRDLDQNFLYSHSNPLNAEVWEDMEVSFIPDKDGAVVLNLMGMWYVPKGEKKNIPIWVEFDEVQLTGAELKNGGFEQLDEKGKVADWNLKGDLIKGKAQAGDNAIKVCANNRALQTIKVTKDQQVTIKAKVKKAE